MVCAEVVVLQKPEHKQRSSLMCDHLKHVSLCTNSIPFKITNQIFKSHGQTSVI